MIWDTRAFFLTLTIFIMALLMCLFLGFSTPLPLPSEQGILISFGDSETGLGATEPRPQEQVQETSASKTAESDYTPESPLTQDYEEAPSIATTKKEPVKRPSEQTTTKKTETETKPVEQPAVNQSALYQGRKKDSPSTGSEGSAGGTGNQGIQSGDPNSSGNSLGSGVGDGISFSLNGRSPVNLPLPDFNIQKEGTVVVRIRVDRQGNVTFAEPGVKGSTTLEKELLDAARRAALASRFNIKEDAVAIQEGTITYIFRLRGK